MPAESSRRGPGSSGYALVRGRLWLAALMAALTLMACLGGEDGETSYFRLEADPILTTFSRVTISLADTAGEVRAILYDDSLPSLARLARLPAGGYRGETVAISILGYREGRLAYRETRIYDGLSRKALSVEISKDVLPGPPG